jgi:hypothetical protein
MNKQIMMLIQYVAVKQLVKEAGWKAVRTISYEDGSQKTIYRVPADEPKARQTADIQQQ